MKLLILLLTCLSLSVTAQNLLTGTTQKSWYLHSRTPEEGPASCNAASAQSQDNTWTFFANGTIEFNHGTVLEDANCQEEDCCSDLVNFAGTWSLTNSGAGLIITAQHETGNASNSFNNAVLFNAAVHQLTEDVLLLKQTSEGVEYTFEFRKR